MKSTLLFSFFILVICACNSTTKPVKPKPAVKSTIKQSVIIQRHTPRELANTLLQTLANNDSKSFGKLMYTKADIAETLKHYTSDSSILEKAYKKQTKFYTENMQKVQIVWRGTRNQLNAKEIDWNDYEITQLDAPIRKDTVAHMERTDITIFIYSNNRTFELLVPNCFKSGNDWTLLQPPYFRSVKTTSPK